MERQNVTLSLPRTLLRKAKAMAARCDKSLSELMKESLEEKISEASGYRKAKKRQVDLLRKGLDLGTRGKVTVSREELHARR